jgi:polysaccharide export outer membrane protein
MKTSQMNPSVCRRLGWAVHGALCLVLLAGSAGCQTESSPPPAADTARSELTLREGDVIRITFPGAKDLSPPEPLQIRRDGKITVPIAGEVMAAGKTPTELQTDLLARLSGQLVSKEVVVTVVSSSFVVFVDGNVIRPGKIVSDHPITLLEAIMEAGGFDYTRADPGKVMVIRRQHGGSEYKYYKVDINLVLRGKESDAFALAPGDVVHVPEKFRVF